MGWTSCPAVLDRLNSICASAPYSLTRSVDPFNFDTQPSQNVNGTYHVQTELDHVEGDLGMTQVEYWRMLIWLARKHQGTPHVAYRALHVDITSLTSTLAREHLAQDYNVDTDDLETEIQVPNGQDFVVGKLEVLVDFDRAL